MFFCLLKIEVEVDVACEKKKESSISCVVLVDENLHILRTEGFLNLTRNVVKVYVEGGYKCD